MKSNTQSIIEKCKIKIHEGKDFIAIKKFVAQYKLDDKQSNKILDEVDQLLAKNELIKQEKTKGIVQIGMGITLFLIGAIVTYISLKHDNEDYMWIGAIIGGILVGIRGLKNTKLKFEDVELQKHQRKKRFQKF